MLSDNLNATHARWHDGVLSHQIVNVRHIPGRINLVGEGLSRKDENLPREPGDGSSWSVIPDWEAACGLEYDLFSVKTATSTLHSELRERFAEENVFLEVIDTLLGIVRSSTDAECKRATHHAEGYFIEDSKLWKLGGATPTRVVSRRECVTK